MKVIIQFFTAEPKPPEIYYLHENNDPEFQKFLERIVELTKSRAKFTVSRMAPTCIVDLS